MNWATGQTGAKHGGGTNVESRPRGNVEGGESNGDQVGN